MANQLILLIFTGLIIGISKCFENTNDAVIPRERFTAVWTRGRDLNYTYIDYEAVDCLLAWGEVKDDLIKYAHDRNTEVQPMTGDPGISKFTNRTFMYETIQTFVEEVKNRNYDGWNFDFEGDTYTPQMKENWVAFLNGLKNEFQKFSPPKKITVAIPFSPMEIYCLDGRCYPYTKMVNIIDYFVIMGYDAEEDWWSLNHYGHSTDPFYRLYKGLREYIDCLELPPYKFILALPWYNWKIKCLKNQEPTDGNRPKDRKYQCSKRSLNEYDDKLNYKTTVRAFQDVKNRVDAQGNDISKDAPNNYYWSEVEDSFYFHVKDPNHPRDIYEYWINAVPGNFTPWVRKLQLAVDSGMSGLGLWATHHLDYENYQSQEEKEFNDEMWKTFREYSSKLKPLVDSPFKNDEYMESWCRRYWDRYVSV